MRETLDRTEKDHARIVAALGEAREHSETVQEAVRTICREWYPFLIQEDRAWYEGYTQLQAYQRQCGPAANVPRSPRNHSSRETKAGSKRRARKPKSAGRTHPSGQEDESDDGDDDGDVSDRERGNSSEASSSFPGLAKLSRWVGTQRKLHRQGQLEEYKVHALEAIQFDFDPTETRWRNQYQALVGYFNVHGHSKVPYNYGPSSNAESGSNEPNGDAAASSSLGAWVKRQQYQYKRFQDGKSSEMTPERIKLLEGVDMVWYRRDKSWMDRYKELQDYKEQHGHIRVHPTENASLVEWIRDQRSRYKEYLRLGRRGTQERDEDELKGRSPNDLSSSSPALNKSQAKLIEEIGLDALVDKREGKWQKHIDQLLTFRSVHGHCLVPNQYPKNQGLATWCKRQRQTYRLHLQGKDTPLTSERIDQLKMMGFEFEVTPERRMSLKLSKSWEEQLAEVVTFKKEKGHLDVPDTTELGHWWKTQKAAFEAYSKHGEQCHDLQTTRVALTLTHEQFQKLKAILFPDHECYLHDRNSDISGMDGNNSWEEWFAELLAHRIHAKTYRIPDACSGLSRWVEEQRNEYSKYISGVPSKLNCERISRLRSVKFPFNLKIRTGKARKGAATKSWEEMFSELLQFYLEHNSFDISPQEKPELSRWIQNQRELYAKHADEESIDQPNHMSQRFKKLKKVGFVFIPEPANVSDESPKPQMLPPGVEQHPTDSIQYGPFLPFEIFPPAQNAMANDDQWENQPIDRVYDI